MLVLKNIITLQQIFSPKKIVASFSIIALAWVWVPVYNAWNASTKLVYPIQEMSKLECRFTKFSELTKDCIRDLPILKTKDYTKYIKKDGWYNEYTRIYTVLWGSSYKYWWDVWNGWHGGTDIATAEGTPVYAIADGKVINAKYMPGWGNNVSIEHEIDGKKIVSNYSHLSKINATYWKTIKANTKIWEVGNTGNSFWNHLHFQIDLDTPFHPYYYDYSKCPYSYSQISESDICFNELKSNTLDPLAFLESNWAILSKVSYTNTTLNTSNDSTDTSSDVSNSNIVLPKILYSYVHMDSDKENIKELQRVFKEMWIYEWSKSWNYNDLKQSLIAYQIEKWVIDNEKSEGAGYFWPKTRTQAQTDYIDFASTGTKQDNPINFVSTRFDGSSSDTKSEITNDIEVEKISRTQILTREEIEQREIEWFRRDFEIDLKFENSMWNIWIWEKQIIKFTINKDNGRPFKWRTPSDITIETDASIVKVFPDTMYQFTDWKRDIDVTGLKKWVTELKVKMWDTVLKTFKVNVFNGSAKIYPTYGSVLSAKKIVTWESKTGFVVMKDVNGTNIMNLKFEGEYTVTSDSDTTFCMKKTDLKNIRNSLKNKCNSSDYEESITFDYDDTASGILVFDYKVGNENSSIKLVNPETTKSMSEKRLLITAPKWLWDDYEYSYEVTTLLKKGIVDGISGWYFLEEKNLSQYDAYNWIENTLVELKKSTDSVGKQEEIQTRINSIARTKTSKYDYLTRKAFLEKAAQMLVFDDSFPEVTIKYKDLDTTQNAMANLVFDSENTWKDKFGENYYRPKETITRGEWAYLISRVLEKKTSDFVTLK